MLALSLLGTAVLPATFKNVGKEISGSQTKQARSLEERRLLTGVTTHIYNSNEAQQSPATITVGGSGSTPGVVATSLAYQAGVTATSLEVVSATTFTPSNAALGTCPSATATELGIVNFPFFGAALVDADGANPNICDDYSVLAIGNSITTAGNCAIIFTNGGHPTTIGKIQSFVKESDGSISQGFSLDFLQGWSSVDFTNCNNQEWITLREQDANDFSSGSATTSNFNNFRARSIHPPIQVSIAANEIAMISLSGTCGTTGISVACTGCSSSSIATGSYNQACTVSSGSDNGNPCFGRDSTFTCRMNTADTTPSDAYDQCFGAAEPTMAFRVRMSELRAGDHVLTLDHGVPAATRVLLNQHVADASSSSVTTLHHANGSLTVTPDHVLRIDGAFAPARTAHVGSVLSMHGGDSVVTRVSGGATEAIINPITTSGTILAADETGAPVLASVYGEWIASYLLHSRSLYPLPASLGSGLSLLFPSLVQAYYDSLLEPAFMAGATDLKAIKAGAPTPVVGGIILGFDVLLAVGFAAYLLAVNPVVTATLAVGFAAARRCSNAKKVA